MIDASASGVIHGMCDICDDTVGALGVLSYLQGDDFHRVQLCHSYTPSILVLDYFRELF